MLNNNGCKKESYRKITYKQGIFQEESADFIKLINYDNRVYKIKLMQNQTGDCSVRLRDYLVGEIALISVELWIGEVF